MATTARDFDEVLEEEIHEIRQRREVCGLHPTSPRDGSESGAEKQLDDEETEERIRNELTGLALSGGGVRSAAFNLGLLQALYHTGRMKDIDYLSTVSGGGYAGAMFSAMVANDKDGVNWDRGSRFNRLPIEPRADGSQPSRVYELALHGRMMSRPLQWLSRHLWGWILTVLFVISGVIAIASLLAWAMRTVWSQENLHSVQAQGFRTDLHIVFYPAFLAFLFWGFCNLAAILMRALHVRIPPIPRFSYVLLIVTLVLSLVSFSAIGDVDLTSFVSADLIPAGWSESLTTALHYLSTAALGLLSLCLLPLLTPHKLLESGRRREKPLYRFAFNVAGFAIICGVPLAVFFLLSRENVSGYNLERPHSDMMTLSHLQNLENFIPRLDVEEPVDDTATSALDLQAERNLSPLALRERVARDIHNAIRASNQEETYPLLRKRIVLEESRDWLPTRLLQYVAFRAGLDQKFQERRELRRDAVRSRDEVVKQINSDVLTNPFLLQQPTRVARAEQPNSTLHELLTGWLGLAAAGGDIGGERSPETGDAETNNSETLTADGTIADYRTESERLLDALRLTSQVDETELEFLTQMLEDIRAPQKVLAYDYRELSANGYWKRMLIAALGATYAQELVARVRDLESQIRSADSAEKRHLADLAALKRIGDSAEDEAPDGFVQIVNDTIVEVLNGFVTEKENEAQAESSLEETEAKLETAIREHCVLDRRTLRLVLTASVMDDLSGSNRATSRRSAAGAGPPIDEGSTRSGGTRFGTEDNGVQFSRRLTLLQQILEMNSVALAEKLDDKLDLAFGDRRKTAAFLDRFKELHEAERKHVASQLAAIRISNWAVLSAMYPDFIKPRNTIYAWNVNYADQVYRLRIALYSSLVFLVVGLLANLNRMCLHGVYRDQLAGVWLPTGPLLLKDLETCRRGGPLHLFNATLNRHGKNTDPDAEGMSRFVLSSRFCGSKRFGYRETWEYENGEMALADAVAISGAAVSTSYAGDLLFRTLMFLTNFRLGQWVRNPKHFHEEHYWPSPLRILISYLWHPTDRAYVDLTDGGHLDNTGLSSLLERRCRVMIVGDCSQDPDNQFADVFCVLQLARAKYGIQIDEMGRDDAESILGEPARSRSIDAFSRLIPDQANHFESKSHFAVLRLTYPEKCPRVVSDGIEDAPDEFRTAVLIVIKPTLTGDEPADLLALRRLNEGFPNDSTVNQFLDPEQFESYVMLGRHIGEQLDRFLLDGGLDDYNVPARWSTGKKEVGSTDAGLAPEYAQTETTVREKVSPAAVRTTAVAAFGREKARQRAALRTSVAETRSAGSSPAVPDRNAVAELLHSVHFDEPGIGVAIALVRQWATAEAQESGATSPAGSEIFDDVIGQVSQWARENGANASLKSRRLFCTQLLNILQEFQWIQTQADDAVRTAFGEVLATLGKQVRGAKAVAASLVGSNDDSA